ncbi:unnamed protein product [Amaranthus hypochondriacus]
MRNKGITILVSALLVWLVGTLATAQLSVVDEEIVVSSIINQQYCFQEGWRCVIDNVCCPGTACRSTNSGLLNPLTATCRKCPLLSESCGINMACCPGFSCSGRISGTCVKDQ